jgi:hypothetical protein
MVAVAMEDSGLEVAAGLLSRGAALLRSQGSGDVAPVAGRLGRLPRVAGLVFLRPGRRRRGTSA